MEAMKDKIENYLNVVHYCLYKAEYSLTLLFNKVNPVWLLVRLLYKIPFIKKGYKKRGVTVQDLSNEINNLSSNKHFGFSVVWAGGLLWGGLGLFFFSDVEGGDINRAYSRLCTWSWSDMLCVCFQAR